jgi:hypothetical protein
VKDYPSYYLAAIVAGMLNSEGNGVSDPITHSYVPGILRLLKDYEPGSHELDLAIGSGVLCVERDPSLTRQSRGFRIVRGITTYRGTGSGMRSNQYQSISVINQADYTAARIRDMEESLFVGRGMLPETLSLVVEKINLELDLISREGILYGFRPSATRATISSQSDNAVATSYIVYPSAAMEFILNTQLLLPIPR